MFITIILFIAIIATLVLVHEFGHFIVAKKSGMRVEEFGFGFPPRLVSIKKGETRYSFNLFPIGGFVKIFGEDGNKRGESGSFTSRPIWTRSLVIVAGVLLNFMLAYFLFSAAHILGMPTIIDDANLPANVENITVQIIEVVPNSPAFASGIKIGDKILKLSNAQETLSIAQVQEVQDFISANSGGEVTFTIKRGKEILNLTTQVRQEFPSGEGATGIALVKVVTIKYQWYVAPIEGAKTFWLVTIGTLVAFGGMIKELVASGSLPSDIAGPVGIAYLTGTVRSLGFVHLLQFIALISLNLGIINLIPFPALDGGRLLFLGIEKLKGSPVPKKIENATHAVGFVILILLIIAVTLKDINRFF